jgi:small subunit ribosomal protein S13
MVRLLGVDLPKDKKIPFALTNIYGIGLKTAQKILTNCKIDLNICTKDLNINEIASLRNNLEFINLKLEGNLRRFNALNIKHLIDINCYRGVRHRLGLPLRGQRTRTNSRTRRIDKKN